MTGSANAPVDVVAILTDLQQQLSDLTGIVEAQQCTLADLTVIVQSQDHALRRLLPDNLSAVSTAAGRPGGV